MAKRKNGRSGVFVLTVGDEILDGRIQNTNAAWFGEQLRLDGIPVIESRSVADRLPEIVAALRAGAKHPVLLVTGGLGPTNDDRTLEAAAKAFGRPLHRAPAALKHVRDRYRQRNLELTEARLKLALVPKGTKVVANPTGTAPGVHLRAGGCDVFFLPGPPNECRPMFTAAVLPLARRSLRSRRLVRREFWRTFGRGESDLYQRIRPIVEKLEAEYPETAAVGVHISFPCIDVTLESWAVPGRRTPSPRVVARATEEITRALGSLCFTREREGLVDAVSRLLKERSLTLATAESCTGGLLGKMLTDLPGSSAYYLGGAVTYANSAKEALLGVNKSTLRGHGAVSAEAVTEMAEGARERLDATFALALSGVSGPGGGSPEKPVGTIYVALSNAQRTRVVHQVILNGRGSRDQNRVIAAHLALDALRSEILGFTEPGISVN